MRLLGLIGLVLLVGGSSPAAAVEFARDILVIQARGVTHRFNVEIASDPDARAQGLMFRQEMAPNAGMLFLYPQDQAVAFWMKNTYLPLDMLFIAADGSITQIVKNAEPLSENLIPSDRYVRGVLELNAGTADRLDIQVGDRILYKVFKFPAAANSK
jgi:uncharacterized membrane protein (UPF0127 family)